MDKRSILKEFIQNELITNQTVELAYDDDLLLSGLVNSLGVIRLVTFVQEHFGLEIPPEDVIIDHFITIDALSTYLETHGI